MEILKMARTKKKDIVEEAVAEARKMKASVLEAAKTSLAEAMSPTIKKIVSDRINEELGGGGDPPANYDEDGEQGRVGEEIPAVGDTGEDLSDEGDGAAVIEAGLKEDDELDLGDEDELDLGDEDEEALEQDEMGDEEDLDLGDEELGGEEDEEIVDVPEEEEEEDVIEIVEDDEMDTEEDEEDEEEPTPVPEASVKRSRRMKKENLRLRKENARYRKALVNLKGRIQEVSLFNARLAGATRLMSEVTLTRREKNSIVDRFDDCESLNEVKRVYKAMKEAYRNAGKTKTNKPSLKSRNSVKSVMTENVNEWSRMAEIAGLGK